MLINVSFSIQNKGMPRLSNPVARQPEAFPVLDGRDTFKDTGYVSWRTYTSDVSRQTLFEKSYFPIYQGIPNLGNCLGAIHLMCKCAKIVKSTGISINLSSSVRTYHLTFRDTHGLN